ncbi:MAG: ABC transporter substrate-binding protein [Alicyclobacillus shizuokensis]|nr:ABC transporter substrate-binding protein [Alicyclobacillus shizuokensis]
MAHAPTIDTRAWMKRLLAVVTISMISASAFGCGAEPAGKSSGSNTSADNTTVTIGVDSSSFSLPFRVAQDEGYFDKYGAHVQLSTYSFGIDTLNAVVTKQANFGEAMDFALLTRLGKGNMKVTSVIASPASGDQILYVRSPISRPSDLKGKRLGVQRGTVNEYIWARYLNQYHVGESQVKLEPLTSEAELVEAFAKGDVDAIWVNKAFESKVKKLPGVKKLADLSAIHFRMVGYLVGDESFVASHPTVVSNILKALNDADRFIREHPNQAADIAYNELNIPKSEVLLEIEHDYDFMLRFTRGDYNELQAILQWSRNNGLITDNVDLRKSIELQPLMAAFPNKVSYDPQS